MIKLRPVMMNTNFPSGNWCHKSIICVILISLATATTEIRAQCTGVCGDVDLNGLINSRDVDALFSYVSSGDSAGIDIQCGNVDSHVGVTLRDLHFLWWYIQFGIPLDCNATSGPIVPLNNPGFLLNYNSVYPAGDTAVTLHIDVTLGNVTNAVAIVLKVRIDGETPALADVVRTYVSDSINDWELAAFNGTGTGNIPVGHLMGAFWSPDLGGPGPGRFALGRAKLIMPASAQPRTIVLEPVEIPVGGNKTLAHEGLPGNPVWTLIPAPWIIDLTGDVNNDRVLTASDVIGLVNYVFKGGAKPYPFAGTGDVNCSGSVTSSDIIQLVNHVFKGGPAPCDVATECTITVDSWTCP